MDPTVATFIGDHPNITFRRAKNLKDTLVHSHFWKQKNKTFQWLQTTGFMKCHNCKVCQIACNTKEIIWANKKIWKIQKLITCKTQFVVYVIEWPCHLKYVGSTICELKKRILEHVRATIAKDRSNAVAKHMEQAHNSDWKQLRFYNIETVEQHVRGGNRERKLRQRESRQILALRTYMPHGLNQGEELYVHL